MKVENRTLRLLLIFVIVWSGANFYNKLYKPKVQRLKLLKDSYNDLSRQVVDRQNSIPDISARQQEVEGKKKEILKTKQEFLALGEQIPRRGELDRFLHFLTLPDYSAGIDFESIQPMETIRQEENPEDKQDKKGPEMISGYKIARYELRVSGDYSGITHYLHYLDNLSKFASITNVKISQDVTSKSNTLSGIFTYSIMISDDPVKGEGQDFNVKFTRAKKEIKSPFQFFKVEEKKTEVVEKGPDLPAYKLSGIISIGNENRAIIDGKFYRVGDRVSSSVVREISKDKVSIETAGVTQELLLVEQGEDK